MWGSSRPVNTIQSMEGYASDSDMRLSNVFCAAAAAAAKLLQLCLTLCDPIPGILQARTLEGVAISFSNA